MIHNQSLIRFISFSWSRISAKPGAGEKHINGIKKAACNDAICHFSARLC